MGTSQTYDELRGIVLSAGEEMDKVAADIRKIDTRPLPRPIGDGRNVGAFQANKRMHFAKCAIRIEEIAARLDTLEIRNTWSLYVQYEKLYVRAIKLVATIDNHSAIQLQKKFLSKENRSKRSFSAKVAVRWATLTGRHHDGS